LLDSRLRSGSIRTRRRSGIGRIAPSRPLCALSPRASHDAGLASFALRGSAIAF
jgi:hypothetical protein